MQFICDQGHKFIYPAKATFQRAAIPNPITYEVMICPICDENNEKFSEFIEVADTVESVYIYELTSGPQTELNKLLADGYTIVNRYAKAYHLEKPKATQPKNPDPDAPEAFQDQAASAYAKIPEKASP